MNDEYALGTLLLFAGNFVPVGYLACNGQTVPISSNSTMWQLIGTTYGGDGTSTFGLPNLPGVAAGNGQQMQWAIATGGTWPDGGVYGIVGQVRPFPFLVPSGSSIADDWLPCNGATVAISDYSTLFALVGTTFGGDGTSTFALPTIAPLASANGTKIPWYICASGIFPYPGCSPANPGLGDFPYDFPMASVCHVAMTPAAVGSLCAFAYCNGQKLPINDQWAALFSLVGTAYGPSSPTSFTLPAIPTGSDQVTSLLCVYGIFPQRP